MISVCMVTYNGGLFIYKQLTSILSQIGSNDEVIISDDGSVDNTISIIKSFNDKRIKFLCRQGIPNLVKNYEYAIQKTKGEYIFLSDQDDIWVDTKVSETMKYLKSYDLVISDCTLIDEKENIINHSYFKLINSRKGIITNIIKNSYLGCCMAFRKNLLHNILPFPKNLYFHDIWIGLIAEIHGNVLFLNKQLVLYRRHPDTLTSAGWKSRNSLLFKIKIRLILFWGITKRYFLFYIRGLC